MVTLVVGLQVAALWGGWIWFAYAAICMPTALSIFGVALLSCLFTFGLNILYNGPAMALLLPALWIGSVKAGRVVDDNIGPAVHSVAHNVQEAADQAVTAVTNVAGYLVSRPLAGLLTVGFMYAFPCKLPWYAAILVAPVVYRVCDRVVQRVVTSARLPPPAQLATNVGTIASNGARAVRRNADHARQAVIKLATETVPRLASQAAATAKAKAVSVVSSMRRRWDRVTAVARERGAGTVVDVLAATSLALIELVILCSFVDYGMCSHYVTCSDDPRWEGASTFLKVMVFVKAEAEFWRNVTNPVVLAVVVGMTVLNMATVVPWLDSLDDAPSNSVAAAPDRPSTAAAIRSWTLQASASVVAAVKRGVALIVSVPRFGKPKKTTVRFNDNVTTHFHDKVPTEDKAAFWYSKKDCLQMRTEWQNDPDYTPRRRKVVVPPPPANQDVRETMVSMAKSLLAAMLVAYLQFLVFESREYAWFMSDDPKWAGTAAMGKFRLVVAYLSPRLLRFLTDPANLQKIAALALVNWIGYGLFVAVKPVETTKKIFSGAYRLGACALEAAKGVVNLRRRANPSTADVPSTFDWTNVSVEKAVQRGIKPGTPRPRLPIRRKRARKVRIAKLAYEYSIDPVAEEEDELLWYAEEHFELMKKEVRRENMEQASNISPPTPTPSIASRFFLLWSSICAHVSSCYTNSVAAIMRFVSASAATAAAFVEPVTRSATRSAMVAAALSFAAMCAWSPDYVKHVASSLAGSTASSAASFAARVEHELRTTHLLVGDIVSAVKTGATAVLDVAFETIPRLVSLWTASAFSKVTMLATWTEHIISASAAAVKTSATAFLDGVFDTVPRLVSLWVAFAVSKVAELGSWIEVTIGGVATAVKNCASAVLDFFFDAIPRLVSLRVATAVSKVTTLTTWTEHIIGDVATAAKTSASAVLDVVFDTIPRRALFSVSTFADSAKVRLADIGASISKYAVTVQEFVSEAAPSLQNYSPSVVVSAGILVLLAGALLFSRCRRAAAFSHQDHAASVQTKASTRAHPTKESKLPAKPACRPSRRQIVFLCVACSISAGIMGWAVSSRGVAMPQAPLQVPVEQLQLPAEQSFGSEDSLTPPSFQPSAVGELLNEEVTGAPERVESDSPSKARVDSFVRAYNDFVERAVVMIGRFPVVSDRFPNLEALQSTIRIDEQTAASMNEYFQRALDYIAEMPPISLPGLDGCDSFSLSNVKDLIERSLMPADPLEASVTTPPVPLPGLEGYDTFSIAYVKDLVQRSLMPSHPVEASVPIPPVPFPGLEGYDTFSIAYVKDLIQRSLMPSYPVEASVPIPPVPLPGLEGFDTFSIAYVKDLIQRSLMPSYPVEASVPTPSFPPPGRDGDASFSLSYIKDLLQRALEASNPDPVPTSGLGSHGSFSLQSIKELLLRVYEPASPLEGRVDHPPAPQTGLDSYSSFSISSIKGFIQSTLMPTDSPEASVPSTAVPLLGHDGYASSVVRSIKGVIQRTLMPSEPLAASVDHAPAPLPGSDGYASFTFSTIKDLIQRTFTTNSEPLNAGSDQPRGSPPTSDHGATRKNQSQYFRALGVSSSSSNLPSATANRAASSSLYYKAKRHGLSAARSALLWLEKLDFDS